MAELIYFLLLLVFAIQTGRNQSRSQRWNLMTSALTLSCHKVS